MFLRYPNFSVFLYFQYQLLSQIYLCVLLKLLIMLLLFVFILVLRSCITSEFFLHLFLSHFFPDFLAFADTTWASLWVVIVTCFPAGTAGGGKEQGDGGRGASKGADSILVEGTWWAEEGAYGGQEGQREGRQRPPYHEESARHYGEEGWNMREWGMLGINATLSLLTRQIKRWMAASAF